MAAAATNGPIP
jgi:hypothetical protein